MRRAESSSTPSAATMRGGSRVLAVSALALAMASGLAAPDKITVLGLFTDRAILVVDGQRRLLRAGEVSPEGVKLVSATSDSAVLEIDGRQVRYGLGNHIGGSFAAPVQPRVTIWPTGHHMYAVVGSINGFPVDFIVDTGATFVSMNSRQARRLGIDYRVDGDPAVSSTASGYSRVFLLTLDRVKVGEIEIRNVKAAVHDGDFPAEVLLGMSFLSRVDIRRDGEMMELRKKY